MVLVVASDHEFSGRSCVNPIDLTSQVLYTYPVEIERLDIYKLFMLPANCLPRKHKTIEATEIMLQLVAAKHGVATLPGWLVEQFEKQMAITAVRLGEKGICKQIHFGLRVNEDPNSFAKGLLALAKTSA